MALIKFDEAVKTQDLPTADIEVPEWGGSVRVRHWTLAERDEFTKRSQDAKQKDKTAEWLIGLLVINEDGSRWLPEGRFAELNGKNPKAIDAIVGGIIKLMAPVTEEQVSAAEKNS